MVLSWMNNNKVDYLKNNKFKKDKKHSLWKVRWMLKFVQKAERLNQYLFLSLFVYLSWTMNRKKTHLSKNALYQIIAFS